MSSLFNQLQLRGDECPSLLQQYLCIASYTLSPKTVKFLCSQMVPHSLSVISQAAITIASNLINGVTLIHSNSKLKHSFADQNVLIDPGLARELLEYILPHKER